jgi:poly(3-hydroxyalkanoate) synthetase
VTGVTDHITQWKGVYRTASLFGGDTEFILNSSSQSVAATPPIYALTRGRNQSWHTHATMTGWRERMVGAWDVDITVR